MDFLQLGKEPISSDAPAGTDIRYEPEFELLQAEIDKLSIPSASGGVNWNEISKLASLILAEKSKDLLVASYMAVSQVHKNRIEGLSVGITILNEMIENFWETLFPPKKRMRGRQAAVEWWLEKTVAAFENVEIDTIDPDTRDALSNALKRLDGLLNERLPDPPALRPVLRIIESIPTQGGEDAEEISQQKESVSHAQVVAPPEERPVSVTDPLSRPVASVPSAASPAKEDAETPDAARRTVIETLSVLSRNSIHLAELDLAQPLPYRCRRLGAWAKLETLPPASENMTRLPPPSGQVVQTLKKMYAEGKWEALLRTSERNLAQYIFWLDLNRFSAEAMIQLGATYEMAHDTVCQETAFFIHRLKGVESLSFSDGMPFADEATGQWLNNHAFGTFNAAPEPIQISQSTETDDSSVRLAETVQAAQRLVKDNKVLDAVKIFQDELTGSSSVKSAFPWRLALCRILLGSKKPQWAIPNLELILSDIDAHRLESWEPDLALQGLVAIWGGFKQVKNDVLNKKSEAILHRIAKLNPVEALRLDR